MTIEWIRFFLSTSGRLSVVQCDEVPGEFLYQASMTWDHIPETISGHKSGTIEGALESLEATLEEDCIGELQESGEV